MLPASVIHATLPMPFGSQRPRDEKIAVLPVPPPAHMPVRAVRRPDQELYVGEIRDAVMPCGLLCPHCASGHVVRYGKRSGVQRYQCKTCMRTFTDFTGTVLHGLRRRDLWLRFCRCLAEGLTVRHTACELGISKNTAFAWRHRAIAALASADSIAMCEGIVELAQLPMLRSFKGSKVPPDARMENLKSSVRRCHRVYGHLIPRSRLIAMVVAVDRAGRTRANVVQRGESVTPALSGMIASHAEVCAPRYGSRFRFGAGWPGGVKWIDRHSVVADRSGMAGAGPLHHVRNANRLIHYFEEWMKRFCGVATKYLLRYFSWYLRWASLIATGFAAAAKLLFFDVLGAGLRAARQAH